MKKKEQAKELAKTLYLEYNGDGTNKYSLQEIANIVTRELHITYTKKTIQNWSNVIDKDTGETWNTIKEKSKLLAVSKATNCKQEVEESIIEEKSNILAKIFKEQDRLRRMSLEVIIEAFENRKEHEIIDIKTALAMNTQATDRQLRMLGEDKGEGTEAVIKIISLGSGINPKDETA